MDSSDCKVYIDVLFLIYNGIIKGKKKNAHVSSSTIGFMSTLAAFILHVFTLHMSRCDGVCNYAMSHHDTE